MGYYIFSEDASDEFLEEASDKFAEDTMMG